MTKFIIMTEVLMIISKKILDDVNFTAVNSLRPGEAYMNQCQPIIDLLSIGTLCRNSVQWNLNEDIEMFIDENILQNVSHFVRASLSWWRHQMETFSALLALCAGNWPVPVNSPHKGQWRGALMFSLICARIKDWVNNREAGDLRRHHGHYDVNVMWWLSCSLNAWHVAISAVCLNDTISMIILVQSYGILFIYYYNNAYVHGHALW